MLLFRIEREKYLHEILSGKGAAASEGNRWNSPGVRMVYSSSSRALALLEVSVHLDLAEDLPADRYLVTLELPDELPLGEITREQLPEGWDQRPPGSWSQQAGDEFVRAAKYPILRVPSSVIPEEYNYLINPMHPKAAAIVVKDQRLVAMNRLWAKTDNF